VIARLTGLIAADDGDGTLVVDVAGVGYEVLAPLGTAGRLRAMAPSGPATVFVHTHVREDAISLFGFATADDRAVFRTLISVSGIGPKIALAILSALSAADLARAIARKELARLTSISGVGKKTAERILLELRDKLPQVADATPIQIDGKPAKPATEKSSRDLLLGALTSMGYRPAEAERAADHVGDAIDGQPLADSIREALRVLSK
jgi:Holliday junction DNA helicase RuvA